MKKEFWHYMENAQENKKLEVQNEDPSTAVHLGMIGANLAALLYTYSAVAQNKDFGKVDFADITQTLTELLGGDTKYEKEKKATLLKIFSGKTELHKIQMQKIEIDNKSESVEQAINDVKTNAKSKKSLKNSIVSKIQNFFGSSDSK